MYSNRDMRVAILGVAVALVIAYFFFGQSPKEEKKESHGCSCR